MKLAESIIAWDSDTGRVAVGPLLAEGRPDWTTSYSSTAGAAFTAVREMKGSEAGRYTMCMFIELVVRDGMDPQAVYRAFMEIDEYRQAIPTSLEGAEDEVD